MDQPIEKMGERAGGLEENLNERFQRLEAEIAREGAVDLTLIEKRLTAAENA